MNLCFFFFWRVTSWLWYKWLLKKNTPKGASFWICPMLRPAYGGRGCTGSSFDYQICNTEECAGPYEDFRAQQCIQRSNKYHNNIKHTWIPYEHPDGELASFLPCSTIRPMSDSGSSEPLGFVFWSFSVFFFFFLHRGPKVWAELQIKGDGRGGFHEPSDARWYPLQLLGPFQRVRTWRLSGRSSFIFRGWKKEI